MAEATIGAQITGCAARRAVLLGLASASAAALAGCGNDEPAVSDPAGAYDTTTQTAAPQSPAPTAPSSAAQPPAGVPSQKPPGGQGAANNLVKTDKVPVGGGVLAGKVLVVQPQAGEFRAYDATCPHAGYTVNPPQGGVSTCPGHGSKFRANDGSRISGPADRGLKQVAVKVQAGWVVRA